MTVLITLTVAGTDSGPFNLYSNLDGFTSAFETGVSKAALLAGYSSALVPDFTTVIRVLSTGVCVNYIDILLESTTTTTTTTTTSGLTQGLISSTSHPTDACSETLDTTCWISNIGGFPGNEVISTSSIVYADSGGTSVFVGDSNFYHVQIDFSSVSTSCQIGTFGDVLSTISICP
jgi:hypothetical protein